MSRRSRPRAVVLGPVLGSLLGLTLAVSTVGPAGAAPTSGSDPLPVVVTATDGLSEPGDLAADPGATVAADAGPAATVSDPWPLREEELTVLGTGFSPEEKVTAELPARLRGQLGTAVVGPDGTVAIPVRAPTALQAGAHEVLLRGTSGATASTSIQLRPVVEDQLTRLARWWPRG
ncbi:hypothetical protein IN07_19855 [Modestobacter caceresii]|uniref:IPT/TIG domain-containing protein n=1 Tax=Modestobacter caceresii TaxID=1522368 RepID=A0A098Y400_9ACTN|nr:hypothetical protein [Modestobacter caceresii]KGH45187.1 hypothetical protein IN07_19855 [Modestobacter caceresii]